MVICREFSQNEAVSERVQVVASRVTWSRCTQKRGRSFRRGEDVLSAARVQVQRAAQPRLAGGREPAGGEQSVSAEGALVA